MPDYSNELNVVNSMHEAMASVAREVVGDLQDGKMSPMEIFMLTMRAGQLGLQIMNIFQKGGFDQGKMLYVLEHMKVTL